MSRLEELFSDKHEKPEEKNNLPNEVTSTEPLQTRIPQYTTEVDNWIECVHGFDGDDYLWHVAPRRSKRQWRMPVDYAITHLTYVLSKIIPKTVEVKIWAPYQEWDIKEITFRAIDLKNTWTFNESIIPQSVKALLKKGNELV